MDRYLITGASRGIGRAIALRLAYPDRTLLLHGRDEKALEESRRLVSEKGAQAVVIAADISTVAGVEQLAERVGTDDLGVLVNNAGVAYVEPFEKITLEHWQKTLAVNVTAPFLLDRLKRGSSIVNILSVAARTAFPNWSSYCMSKFALEGFSRCLREEMRSRGIRVINIYPSATATGMWDGVEGDWEKNKMLPPEEVAEALAYALERPSAVMVEDISLGDIAGNQ
jgi:NAD(P)-dependent dehydrogenase (short-subunit alcohol dehydrogenase family)